MASKGTVVVADQFCACCGKREGMVCFVTGEPPPPHYCPDCVRAIRVAQMQATNTLPKV